MKRYLLALWVCVFLAGCSAHQKTVQVAQKVQPVQQEDYKGLKRKVAISRFSNETQYAKGVFYDKENDPIAKQALDILSTKLTQSNKFILLERNDWDKISQEEDITGQDFQKVGADYLIIGSVTQFGRKNVGDVNVFSRSKTQTVEAGVSLRLIDVSTGQIVYSEEAKGEAETSSKTVMGLGERTDYDASLSDKAISSAISKLVENVINNLMDSPWKSYFLSYDDEEVLIAGGKNQGITKGDTFAVMKKGKQVKNPQTGMMINLPGDVVGKVNVNFVGGRGNNEFSMVSFTDGDIDPKKLEDYYIKEI